MTFEEFQSSRKWRNLIQPPFDQITGPDARGYVYADETCFLEQRSGERLKDPHGEWVLTIANDIRVFSNLEDAERALYEDFYWNEVAR